MQKVNIAVVGAGLIGRKHIELVDASAECCLCALADPSENASSLAERYNTRWFRSFEEVLEMESVDAVILATPNPLHFAQSIACIERGVAVLVEKPVTQSIQEAQDLLARCEELNARVLVGHHRMHSSIMQSAKEVIDAGTLGDLVAVQGAALFYKPDEYFRAGPWRTRSGGGPILINLIHEVGNLRYLCGEITRVQAMPSNARRGFEVEDTVGILIAFENGAVGTFILSDAAGSCKSWEQTARENTDYHYDADEHCYHIAGTAGSLSIPTMELRTFAGEASWWAPMRTEKMPRRVDDPLVRQLSHFCGVVRGEAAPLVSVYDGLQNLKITEEIARASQICS